MTEEARKESALDILRRIVDDARVARDEGGARALNEAVEQLFTAGHMVDRLAHCDDIGAVYDLLDVIGGMPRQSTKMAKFKMRVRTRRAEWKASGTGEAADLEAEEEDVPSGVVVPRGYQVNPDGVFEGDGDLVTNAPLLMTAVYSDVDSGKARVRLSWTYKGKWLHRVVPRNQAMDGRQLVALSEALAPVNSATSTAVVRWLSAQEAASDLPVRHSTSRQGWHGPDGSLGFVLGTTGEGQPEGEWPVELQLSAEDERGPRPLAAALSEKGTLQEWREMMSEMAERPISLLGLGASASAILTGVIPGTRSFVLDVYADTSSGKTSAARAWASVWGCWETTEIKWDATKVGLERCTGFLRHLPTFVDDTKHAAKEPQKVVGWIYDVCGVRGKARGTRNSFELGGKTDTIGIVTGEVSATTIGDFAHGGAMARVLSITGEFTPSAEAAKRMEQGALLQYGTAGRAIVRHLLAERDRDGWAKIREDYAALEVKYSEQLVKEAKGETSRVAHRAGPYLALIHLGLRLLRVTGAVDFSAQELRDAMTIGVKSAVSGVKKADLPRASMAYLLQWAASQRRRLYTPTAIDRDPDPGHSGWAGRWCEKGLHFIPAEAEKVVSAKYDWSAVYGAWKREGLLKDVASAKESEEGKVRYTKNRRVAPGFGPMTPKCFTISAEAMAIVFDVGTAEGSE